LRISICWSFALKLPVANEPTAEAKERELFILELETFIAAFPSNWCGLSGYIYLGVAYVSGKNSLGPLQPISSSSSSSWSSLVRKEILLASAFPHHMAAAARLA
jgi:hypothetical protein